MGKTTDIYSAAYSLFWFPRILGLAPISVKDELTIRKFQPSAKMLLHSVFMAGGVTALSLCITYKIDYNFKTGPTIIFKMQDCADTAVTVAFIFTSCLNHRKLILTVTNIDYFDRNMLSIGVPISFKLHIWLVRIQALCTLIFILIPISFLSYSLITNNTTILAIASLPLSILKVTISFYVQS
jgi:hypothetical protein